MAERFFRSRNIFEPGTIPAKQCHASTIVEAGGRELAAAWFGGPHEGHPAVGIWLAHYRRGQWDPPILVADVPGVPLWNPVLFRDRQTRLWLFYKVGASVPEWTGAYLRSLDGGYSWSSPTYLAPGLLGPAKNKPITLSNGDILCGTSCETWASWACWVELSHDDGEMWSRHGPITWPKTEWDRPGAASAAWDGSTGELILPNAHAGVIQPAVWEYAPGRLKMLMRATRRIGRICEATSDDYGRTWSHAAPTGLPNPNSGIDAARLEDGRIALAYNPSASQRTPLAVALSADNGATWPWQRVIEGGAGEFSYPAIIQAEDGLLQLTYTWRRQTIRHVSMAPEWIAAG